MIRLYHSPGTRSIRVYWLLEELSLPYELVEVPFVPPSTPFSQATPLGKVPVIEDGDLTLGESGAILEYVLERYGGGRLAPPPGSPLRGPFFYWVHFAEATAMPPLGQMVWEGLFKPEADRNPSVIDAARGRAAATLRVVEQGLAGRSYLVGDQFSGADIMMGYTLLVARLFGVLTGEYPNLTRYEALLGARPAYRKATGR
jgi:glutathione S-transferase